MYRLLYYNKEPSVMSNDAFLSSIQGARGVLRNSETVSVIMNEWRTVDFAGVAQQAAYRHHIPEHSIELFQECK